MFAIAQNQRQYTTYTLTDSTAQSRVEIVPERGGILTQWQIQNQEILYLDTERFTHPELSVRGGIPILFPICGNLPDNTYTLDGQPYTLKQHGFARDLPWQVSDRSTQDSASLTLTLTSNDQTRAVYPFEFHVAFTYQLRGNQLEIQQSYTNTGDRPLPFSTGLHPYFCAPDKSQLKFDIPATQYRDQQTKTLQTFTGMFDFAQPEIDAGFEVLTHPNATVTDLSRKLQLSLDFDPAHSLLVFWTLQDKPFYCLEPWTAPRNALNNGDRLLHLAPGETWKTWVRFNVAFL